MSLLNAVIGLMFIWTEWKLYAVGFYTGGLILECETYI